MKFHSLFSSESSNLLNLIPHTSRRLIQELLPGDVIFTFSQFHDPGIMTSDGRKFASLILAVVPDPCYNEIELIFVRVDGVLAHNFFDAGQYAIVLQQGGSK